MTIIHAQDDYDIPWTHSPQLFWRAVNATTQGTLDFDELQVKKAEMRQKLSAGGGIVEWKSKHGIIREEILRYGLQDVIMGNPVISVAVMRILESME